MIKPNIFTRKNFIIHCSILSCPFSSCIFKIILNLLLSFHNIFNSIFSKERILTKLRIFTDLFFSFWVQNSYHRLWLFKTIKSISLTLKYTISLGSFFLWSCQCSCWSLTFSFYSKIILIFLSFFNPHKFLVISSRIWSFLWI